MADPLLQGLGFLGTNPPRRPRIGPNAPVMPLGYNRLPGILAGETPTFSRPRTTASSAPSEFEQISEQFAPARGIFESFGRMLSRENLPYLAMGAGSKLTETLLRLSAPVAAAMGKPETAADYAALSDILSEQGDMFFGLPGPGESAPIELPELTATPRAGGMPAGGSAADRAASRAARTPSPEDAIALPSPSSVPARGKMPIMGGAPGAEEAPEVDVQKGQEIAIEEGLKAGIDEYLAALGDDAIPQPKSIDEYKKIFAEATGIDISGKPDKSQALMAFGLALMQNRAGSGFNVGNMLRSIGEAGEAALPALAEARKEARAGQLAAGQYSLNQLKEAQSEARQVRNEAGKYALQQLQAGRSATAAIAEEQRAHEREIQLKLLEMQLEAEKAAAEGIEFKNSRSIPVTSDSGVNITVGLGPGNVTNFVTPSLEAPGVVNAYNKYTRGQELTAEMIEIIERIAQSDAPGLTKIYQDAAGFLRQFGVDLPGFDPNKPIPASQADALRNSILVAFKPLIIQESQVSDRDQTSANESIGMLTAASDIQTILETSRRFYDYLSAAKAPFEVMLNQLQDPFYYGGRRDEFEKTQEVIRGSLRTGEELSQPPGAAGLPEGVVGSVDLRTGAQ